jgi:hypothetical protein
MIHPPTLPTLALQMLLAIASGREQKKPGTTKRIHGNHDRASQQRDAQYSDRGTDFGAPFVDGRTSDGRRRLAQRHAARAKPRDFLFENDEDFEMVCTAAGLDSHDFRVRLLKVGRLVEARAPFSLCFAT